MIISIHQPNFCPYNGFFQKVAACDVFVIMRCCQFEKNNYQNRFFDGEKWQTMRVSKSIENIIDKEYLFAHEDFNKIIKKHPNLNVFNHCIRKSVSDTNINIIIHALKLQGIKTKIVFDYPTELKGTERLIDIVKTFKGTTYLSGISGKNYLNLQAFKDNNIELLFQENIINKPFNEII